METSSKTVYFVRHGQSEANTQPVYQPFNTPLTEKGRMQAERIAERISQLSFDALLCSPLVRTVQTCEAITKKTGKIPEYSEIFRERQKPLELEGRPNSDPEARELWGQWHASLYSDNLRVKDGENFGDVVTRVDAALNMLQNHEAQTLVVVSHGWFIRAVMSYVLLGGNLTPETLKSCIMATETENTGITVLKYEKERWGVWIYNDHAHLG